MLYINNKFLIVKDTENDCNYIINKKTEEKENINNDLYLLLEYIYIYSPIHKEDLLEFSEIIDELLLKDILIDCTFYRKTKNLRVTSSKTLERVFLELTKQCNLHCNHCYNNSNLYEENYLSTEDVFSIIDEAVKNNVIYFQITGGEPLIRNDFKEIIEYLFNNGFIITIFSNLTLLTEEDAQLMSKYFIHSITSLDFFDKTSHDLLRGLNGAYDKTLSSIKLLKRFNVPIRINFMINDKNLSELNDLIGLFKELNCKYIGDLIIPVGRGNKLGQYENLIEISKLYAYINTANFKSISDTEVYITTDYSHIICYDCKVGTKFIFIDFQGNYILCPSLRKEHNENFYFGSIYSTQMSDLIPLMSSIDIKCRHFDKCKYYSKCNGGCRSRAYHLSGELNSPDNILCNIYNVKEDMFNE